MSRPEIYPKYIHLGLDKDGKPTTSLRHYPSPSSPGFYLCDAGDWGLEIDEEGKVGKCFGNKKLIGADVYEATKEDWQRCNRGHI